MFIRKLIVTAVIAAFMATSSAASATTGDAAQFVQRLADQTIEALRAPDLTRDERREKFRGLLVQGFDISFIGRFVIGRYWRAATPVQRGDYMDMYNEFFLTSYVTRVSGYTGQRFMVTGTRVVNAKDVVVRSLIKQAGGQPFTMDWRVRKHDGRYRVIDVMVEGISLAVTQRAEFASVAQRGGLDGLLTSLRERTTETPEVATLN